MRGTILLGFLSDNYHKQSHPNTVVSSQKEVDRVGFEPTTLAQQQLSKAALCTIYLKAQL
jgi:hypothetical protein